MAFFEWRSVVRFILTLGLISVCPFIRVCVARGGGLLQESQVECGDKPDSDLL